MKQVALQFILCMKYYLWNEAMRIQKDGFILENVKTADGKQALLTLLNGKWIFPARVLIEKKTQ